MKTLKEISAAYKKLDKLCSEFDEAFTSSTNARYDSRFDFDEVAKLHKVTARAQAKLLKTMEGYGLPTADFAKHLTNEFTFTAWIINLNLNREGVEQ